VLGQAPESVDPPYAPLASQQEDYRLIAHQKSGKLSLPRPEKRWLEGQNHGWYLARRNLLLSGACLAP
jgi:hypothetical protein